MRLNKHTSGQDVVAEAASAEFFGRSFEERVMEAERCQACSRQDLIDEGWVIFAGMVGVGVGEIATIRVESDRFPRPGEYREIADTAKQHFADALIPEEGH